MDNISRFRIAIQTILDYKKTTIILTLLFMAIAVMYCGMYPAFKEPLEEMPEISMLLCQKSHWIPWHCHLVRDLRKVC